jgi:hypothetical protein
MLRFLVVRSFLEPTVILATKYKDIVVAYPLFPPVSRRHVLLNLNLAMTHDVTPFPASWTFPTSYTAASNSPAFTIEGLPSDTDGTPGQSENGDYNPVWLV